MRASILFAAAVLPVLSLAQSSEAIAFLNTLPDCAAVTVRIEASKTSCGFDITCLCKDSSFIATVMSGTTCTPPKVVEFGGLVAKECASKGVTVDVPGGDGGDSGSGAGGGNAEDKPNWGERVTVVDVGMMLGAAGLVALVGLQIVCRKESW